MLVSEGAGDPRAPMENKTEKRPTSAILEPFPDGSRVAFFGDSITQNIARDYLRDKPQEAALRARVEEIQS